MKELNLPMTFTHGNFCPHNIAIDDSGIIAPYDFGRSAIGFGILEGMWFGYTSAEQETRDTFIPCMKQ